MRAGAPMPTGEHLVPIDKAAVLRAGQDVMLVSYAKTVGARACRRPMRWLPTGYRPK